MLNNVWKRHLLSFVQNHYAHELKHILRYTKTSLFTLKPQYINKSKVTNILSCYIVSVTGQKKQAQFN